MARKWITDIFYNWGIQKVTYIAKIKYLCDILSILSLVWSLYLINSVNLSHLHSEAKIASPCFKFFE